jgi:dCTP deaminase
MILSHDQIAEELKKGNIQITPNIDPSQISGASIDLRLGNIFRTYKKLIEPIPVINSTDYRNFSEEKIAETILLHPQETILGITMERIKLPGNISAWIEGRSRFARLGLLIHISAGFIQPGVNNQQVLEMTNLGPNTLELHAGERICQLVFQRMEGNSFYQGRFVDQTRP